MSTQHLTKTYSDRRYIHTAMVRHNGTVVAFAMDDQRSIHYAVLALDQADAAKGELDVAYWSDNPTPLSFPGEITEVGYAVAGTTPMPVVKKGGRIESSDDLGPDEIDAFLSTTARLSAAEPFKVLTDGKYVYVFRQAVAKAHPDAVFVLSGGGSSGDAARKDYVMSAGAKVPVVDAMLLCDRFVLGGAELKPCREVRYRRSRHKAIPDSLKDTLGAEDMDGKPFFEPTQALSFIRNLDRGRFAVTLLSTTIADLKRWQIFAYSPKTGRIDSFNVERADDGLFNTQGSVLYTSPEPDYQSAVLERAPGPCPLSGKPMVPLLPESDYAETAFGFDGTNHVDISAAKALSFPAKKYTIEAWIQPSALGREMTIVSKGDRNGQGTFLFGLFPDGRLHALHWVPPWEVGSVDAVTVGQYHHVAVTYDGSVVRFYLNGKPSGVVALGYNPETAAPLRIGAVGRGAPAELFAGAIDEVRIWNRQRDEEEINRDKGFRLVGDESGLVAYYRFDEGGGARIYDQTDSAFHGDVKGALTWVTSTARIGERPSIRRDSFRIVGRTVESGMSALLYFQQETSGGGDPMKRQARVMLACATGGPGLDGAPTTKQHIAVIDFAVARDGRLAQIPDEVTLPALSLPAAAAALDDVSAAEQDLKVAEALVAQLSADIDALNERIAELKILFKDTPATGWAAYWQIVTFGSRNDGNMAVTSFGPTSGTLVLLANETSEAAQWQFIPAPDSRSDDAFTSSHFLRNRKSGLYLVGEFDTVLSVGPTPKKWILGPTNAVQVLGGWVGTVAFPWAVPVRILRSSNPPQLTFSSDAFQYTGTGNSSTATTAENFQISKQSQSDLCTKELSDKQQLLVDKRAQLIQATIDRDAKRDALSGLSKGLRGETLTLPMGTLSLDRCGLPVGGALLGFAWSDAAPLLFDSTTGQVVLYFRGQDNGLTYAAYYEPSVMRDVLRLGAADKGLSLVATSAGLSGSDLTVTLKAAALPEECTLTLECPSFSETWRNMPRSPRRIAEILSGDSAREFLGTLASQNGPTITLAQGAARALATGARLQIGGEVVQAAGPSNPGATVIALSTLPKAAPVGQVVYYLPYDYAKATCTRVGSSLAGGSLLVRPIPTLLTDPLADGTAQRIQAPAVGRWHGDAPGRSFSLNGKTSYLSSLSADGSTVSVSSDVTMEAWVKADVVTGTARLIATAVAGDATAPPAPPVNMALALNGKTYVQCGSALALAKASFTIELWARRTQAGRYECLLTHGADTRAGINTKLMLLFVPEDQLVVSFYGEDLWDPKPISDTDWHHIAFTHNGATSEVILYRDGAEAARRTRSAPYNGSGNLLLGTESTADLGYPSTSAIDEVRIWSVIRTAAEIQGEMKSNRLGTEPGLLGLYSFAGSQARDITLHNKTTTLVGKAQYVASLLPQRLPTAPVQYTLGLSEATLETAFAFDGKTFIACGDKIALANRDFTIEVWVRRTKVTGSFECVLTHGPDVGGAGNAKMVMMFTQENKLTVGFWVDDLLDPQAITDTNWHHFALTHDARTFLAILYRDGAEVTRRQRSAPYAGVGNLVFGVSTAATLNAPCSSEVDDVRIWGYVRSAREIRTDMGRRLARGEGGLLGYWYFADKMALDYSGAGNHGDVVGTIKLATSPLGKGYRVFAGVGSEYAKSREIYPVAGWRHVAFALRQSWGVRLEGTAYLEVAHDDALDVTGDLTIEAFVKLSRLGCPQPLVCKGRLSDGSGKTVPYCFSVQADGRLAFAFETSGGAQVVTVSSGQVSAGTFYRLAVIRKGGTSQNEKKATKMFGGQAIEVTERVDVQQWVDIRLYIDGNDVGGARHEGDAPLGHDAPLTLGRSSNGTNVASFQGDLAELRLWKKAREIVQLGKPVTPADSGLLARWRFPENKGNVTQDETRVYPARLRGARWIKTPDPRGSQAWLYVNGSSVEIDRLVEGDELLKPVTSAVGLCLGALVDGDGTPQQPFGGELEEVRVWRSIRAQEQILDNLFTRLKGEKQDLLAYYTFDDDSTRPDSVQVNDNGLRGNHLLFVADGNRPDIVLSTAPVSNDAAEVRSALAGVKTSFHDTVSTTPGIAEYGDTQVAEDGSMRGIMKRSYSFLRGGAWDLVTGYKIGNMVVEWVSQAQFDPQVIGFIEGAPPVPSENITVGAVEYIGESPKNISKIDFVQADEVTTAQSSSQESSFEAGFQSEVTAGFEFGTEQLIAPFGLGISIPIGKVDMDTGFAFDVSGSDGWSAESRVQHSQKRSRELSVALTGYWEDPAHLQAPTMGRRFITNNVGFALVQSETADVYAMRLEHNRALIGYRMVPNADIPKDWNLIPFPINPRYTKQGCLDGSMGFDNKGKICDPDYLMATQYGEYSYFKPTEAYAIKRRILREEQQQASYLYRAAPTSRGLATRSMTKSMKALEGLATMPDLPKEEAKEAVATFAKRNLCDTYVWTASGGLFSEKSETMDVVSETMASSRTEKMSGSISFGLGTEIAGVELGLQMDASFGSSETLTSSVSSEAARSYCFDMQLDLPRTLQKFLGTAQPVFDSTGNPVLVPGKVDAYRFMTFYLDTDRRNTQDLFRKVIDPIWLAQSSDPNAIALRQAQGDVREPPCWRVMHRVTFVSRLLPPVPPPGTLPLETAMRVENVASNYELIKRLEPYVKDSLDSSANLADATREAIKAYLPALVPHEEQVRKYLELYYGVPS